MYIFGYGSIINKDTRTNASSIDLPVRLHGYLRDWNAPIESDSATALGITPKDGMTCNGVLLHVSSELLSELDEREKVVGYRREELSMAQIEFLAEAIDVDEPLHTYVPMVPTSASSRLPVEQTYIDTVLYGCLMHGEPFLREFITTTRSWDYPMLQDREHPNYPRWKPVYVSARAEEIFREEVPH